jgi:hypothetical protein
MLTAVGVKRRDGINRPDLRIGPNNGPGWTPRISIPSIQRRTAIVGDDHKLLRLTLAAESQRTGGTVVIADVEGD